MRYNQSLPSNSFSSKNVPHLTEKRYRIQGNDIKGQKLVKTESGRKAISHLLKELEHRSKFSVFHKKYLLAVKLFEYIFEPVLAEKNSMFYYLGFHKFISNFLYIEFMTIIENAEDIFGEFSTLMRQLDNSELKLEHIFNSSALSKDELTMLDSVKNFLIFPQRLY
jgi:hypothetical protein